MTCRHFALLIVFAHAAVAAEPAAQAAPQPAPPSRNSSKWVFSLLPKSLQRRPSLDFHVITEMTAEGKKLTPPTAAKPTYYLEQPGKFTQLGNNTPGNEHAPPVTELERAIRRALASSSYLPAMPSTPLPQIAVVFNYGSFARFSTDADDFQQTVAMEQVNQQQLDADPNATPMDPYIPSGDERDVESLLPLVLGNAGERTDILQRADLIGGAKFARGLAAALSQESIYEQTYAGLGSPAEDQSSPFNRFRNANENLMALVEESFSSCYFVVASAYDYRAMRKGQRVLLWRTKMTVNSSGISMTESLAPLIVTAGPYLGRDMTDSVTVTRVISREGHVEIGTPIVVEDKPPEPTPSTKPTKEQPQRPPAGSSAPGGPH
jgi:hypothetical protein